MQPPPPHQLGPTHARLQHLPARARAAVRTQFDVKNRRHFLKRIKYDGLAAEQLFPGAVVTVYARQLRVTDFGDDATRRAVEARAER